MLKFVVVIYKKRDMSVEDFRRYFRDVHGPMVQRIPGLRKYVQNYLVADPKRKPPGWHGIAELFFEDWEAMETAWSSEPGVLATNDLEAFVDLTLTSWSVVEEATLRQQ
jgi:uncharacterized protein (TIGR02118 family)